jgi:hypothetical protein
MLKMITFVPLGRIPGCYKKTKLKSNFIDFLRNASLTEKT